MESKEVHHKTVEILPEIIFDIYVTVKHTSKICLIFKITNNVTHLSYLNIIKTVSLWSSIQIWE